MVFQVSKKAPNKDGQILFDVVILDGQTSKVVEQDLTYVEAQDYCAAKMKKDDRFQLDLYGEITYTYNQPEFVQLVAKNRHERKQHQVVA